MELIIIEIFLQAFLLMSLLYIIARHEADFSFDKVAIVTAVITLVSFFVTLLLEPHIGIFYIIPAAAFFILMIIRFCWVSWWKAIIITVLFYALYFMFMLLIGYLIKEAFEKDAPETLTEKKGKEIVEAVNISREILGIQQPAKGAGTENTTQSLPPSENKTPSHVSTPSHTKKENRTFTSDQEAARHQIEFKGFITDHTGKRTALVNGQYIAEGETITTKYKREKYIWRLKKIGKYGPEWELIEKTD